MYVIFFMHSYIVEQLDYLGFLTILKNADKELYVYIMET